MAGVDLDQCYGAAVDLADRAGRIAYNAYQKGKCVEAKAASSDLVTETDRAIEEFILKELRQKFPTHSFIGEESIKGPCVLTDNPTWMIDPIDGTSNFIHGLPFSAVCIGLAVDKKAVVGAVNNFVLGHLFAAQKGCGATLNGEPIHVSTCTELNQSMILTELGSKRPPGVLRSKMETLYKIAVEPNPVHGFRSLGSAALSMCHVACGHVDLYYEYGVHCWDIAAANIIVEEAGGVSMMPDGAPLNLMGRGVLCACTETLTREFIPLMEHVDYPADQQD